MKVLEARLLRKLCKIRIQLSGKKKKQQKRKNLYVKKAKTRKYYTDMWYFL